MPTDYKETAPSILAKSGFGTITLNCTSRESKGNDFSRDAKEDRQLSLIIDAFANKPRTMLQVARKTGIERASICRRVAELRKQHRIFLCGREICPISGHRAGYYTTSTKEAFIHYAKSCAPVLSGLRPWEKTLIRKAIIRIVNDGVTPLDAQTQLPIELWGDWWKCYYIIRKEGYLASQLRYMNPERALAHCTNITTPVWSNAGLGHDGVIELWRIFRDYIANNYEETSIPIPATIKDVWESCKNLIDKESQL